MSRFVLDAGAVLHLASAGIKVRGAHKLLAPTLLRSQTLSALHEAVQRGVRHAPFWGGTEAIAPTLAYDHTGIMGKHGSIPTERVARVHVPTLVMTGGNGAPFMLETARTLIEVIPAARLRTLDGQIHDVHPGALAPVLVEFFAAASDSSSYPRGSE